MTSRHGNLRTLAGICAGLALLAAGCTSSTSPAEDVPELRTRLAAVDRAIADHRLGLARTEIARLVQVTIAAREAGTLEPDEAETVLAAAAGLASYLPDRTNDEPPSRNQDDKPTPDRDDDDQEKRRDELEKKREEQEKKDEADDDDEDKKGGDDNKGEGGGNGKSSGNGPDDGHGN